jgi:hypothetical protein
MAAKYYRANNGLNDTSSWSLTPNGATGAAVPQTGDDVYFLELTGEITDDLTFFATNVPDSITVGPGCRLTIGAGSSMRVGDGTNTCEDITYQGSGSQWAFDAEAENAIDDIRINTIGSVTITKSDEATAIDNVYVSRGTVNIRGDLKPNVYSFGGEVDIRGGGTVAVLDCLGGRVTCQDTVTTLSATGQAIVSVTEAASVTTANVNGGRVNLRSTGTTTTLNQKGGTVTPEGGIGTHTITTANLLGTNQTTRFVSNVGLSALSVGTTNKFGTVKEAGQDVLGNNRL